MMISDHLKNRKTDGKELFSTHNEGVLGEPIHSDLTGIERCTQEEADTRIILHVKNCMQSGLNRSFW